MKITERSKKPFVDLAGHCEMLVLYVCQKQACLLLSCFHGASDVFMSAKQTGSELVGALISLGRKPHAGTGRDCQQLSQCHLQQLSCQGTCTGDVLYLQE